MKSILISLFLLVSVQNSIAQLWDNHWRLGYFCCQPMLGGMDIDFSSGSPMIDTVNFSMPFSASNATMSDSMGHLIFYTNGYYVANVNDDTMLNGAGINPGQFADNYSATGEPIAQADLVLPAPGNSNLYYLFHLSGDYSSPAYEPSRLFYSIIDMSMDGGLGAVVSKNNVLFIDTLSLGGLSGCKHANGRDWWIVLPKQSSNLYYIILLTPYGVQYSTQNIGPAQHLNGTGQNAFSPDGNWYCRYDHLNGMTLMQFDRCTGLFSNLLFIPESQFNDSAISTGVAFSPNSMRLYLSSYHYLYQYDLTSPSQIQNSRTTAAIYDGFVSFSATNFYLEQLGRNGKIYITSGPGSPNRFHVINSPDSLGMACDVQQHAIILPRYNASTIANFPNYRLGALGGSVCDSLITWSPSDNLPDNLISAFPNPCTTSIRLTWRIQTNREIQLKLFDVRGINVYQEKTRILNQDIDVSHLTVGIYFLEIAGIRDIVRMKIVKL